MFSLKNVISIIGIVLLPLTPISHNHNNASALEIRKKDKQQSFAWEGNWYLEGSGIAFDVWIGKKDGAYVASHCWTDKYSVGSDCASGDHNTLTKGKVVNSSILEFRFQTQYGAGAKKKEDYYGKVRLKAINANTIEWHITEQPVGRTLIPEKTTLKRYQN